jgi:hypothetical protein
LKVGDKKTKGNEQSQKQKKKELKSMRITAPMFISA